MKQNYLDRAMRARDPRFAKIAGKLGYGTRQMSAAPVEDIAAAPVEDIAAAPVEDIAAVRDEYARAVGRKPFMGWDIPTLRMKIAEAKKAG